MARSLGQNQKLASASFAKLQFWPERTGAHCRHLKSSNGSKSPGLKGFAGRAKGRKKLRALEQNKKGLQYKSPNWTRMKKRLIHSNVSKIIIGFLIKLNYMHLLTSPNIWKNF